MQSQWASLDIWTSAVSELLEPGEEEAVGTGLAGQREMAEVVIRKISLL